MTLDNAIGIIQTIIKETELGQRNWQWTVEENVYISEGYVYKENQYDGRLYDDKGGLIYFGFPYTLSETIRHNVTQQIDRTIRRSKRRQKKAAAFAKTYPKERPICQTLSI